MCISENSVSFSTQHLFELQQKISNNVVCATSKASDQTIVLRRRDTKESTCLLWDITTEKSSLCCYAVRIPKNTYVKK